VRPRRVFADLQLGGVTGVSGATDHEFGRSTRVQIVREFRPWEVNGSGPEVTVRNGGSTVAIYGPQLTGLSYGNIGYKFTDVRYQVIDNFSIVTWGTPQNLVSMPTAFEKDNLQSWVEWHLHVQQLERLRGTTTIPVSAVCGNRSLETSIHQIALYVQNEWRVHPRLTISPGLRYEIALLPDYYPATVPQNRFPLATTIPEGQADCTAFGLLLDGRQLDRCSGGRRVVLCVPVHAGVRTVNFDERRESGAEQSDPRYNLH